jgi:outer membrane protein TolC
MRFVAALFVVGTFASAAAVGQDAASSRPSAEPTPPTELTLDAAVALTLKNNLGLRSALIDARIEETRIREALGAFDPTLYGETNAGRRQRLTPGLFPDPVIPGVFRTQIITSEEDSFDATLGVRGKLVTGATYDLSAFNFYQFDRAGSPFNPIWSSTVSLRVTQPLLRGAFRDETEAELRAAENRAEQARQTFRGEEARKIREVEVAYFDLLSAYEDVASKRRSLDVSETLVRINRVKVDAGAFAPVEMTGAEAGRAARRSDLVTAEANLLDAEDRLRREIYAFDAADEWTLRLKPVESLDVPIGPFLPAETIVAAAKDAEPRLLKARLAAALAEDELERRKADGRAKLDLAGSTSFTGLDEDGLQPWGALFDRSESSLTWSVGLVFETTLGNRAANAREAAAALALTKTRVDLKNVEIDVEYNVRKTLRDLDVAARVIAARQEALRLADEQVEVERVKLEAQTTTNLQVFEAEDQRAKRRAEYVAAKVSLRLAALDLVRITGLPMRALLAAP